MIIPDPILRLMNPQDRPKGNAGLLREEAITKAVTKTEREEQKDFRNWLRQKKAQGLLTFGCSQAHKATTRELGEPDFAVYARGGKTLFLEFKVSTNKLTPEQESEVELLTSLGHLVAIPRTALEAISITRRWMEAP